MINGKKIIVVMPAYNAEKHWKLLIKKFPWTLLMR